MRANTDARSEAPLTLREGACGGLQRRRFRHRHHALILEIKVPHDVAPGRLGAALAHLWPSFLAFFTSFATIGVMWVNHHRLFTLIRHCDDGLVGLNLLLLLGVTWVPFPTALLAEHLHGADQGLAGLVYGATFFGLAIVFNVLWRYVARAGLAVEHLDVASITSQYALGPVLYAVTAAIGWFSGTACLIVRAAIALYFALPPRVFGAAKPASGAAAEPPP